MSSLLQPPNLETKYEALHLLYLLSENILQCENSIQSVSDTKNDSLALSDFLSLSPCQNYSVYSQTPSVSINKTEDFSFEILNSTDVSKISEKNSSNTSFESVKNTENSLIQTPEFKNIVKNNEFSEYEIIEDVFMMLMGANSEIFEFRLNAIIIKP